jgi:hypothetical protein
MYKYIPVLENLKNLLTHKEVAEMCKVSFCFPGEKFLPTSVEELLKWGSNFDPHNVKPKTLLTKIS